MPLGRDERSHSPAGRRYRDVKSSRPVQASGWPVPSLSVRFPPFPCRVGGRKGWLGKGSRQQAVRWPMPTVRAVALLGGAVSECMQVRSTPGPGRMTGLGDGYPVARPPPKPRDRRRSNTRHVPVSLRRRPMDPGRRRSGGFPCPAAPASPRGWPREPATSASSHADLSPGLTLPFGSVSVPGPSRLDMRRPCTQGPWRHLLVQEGRETRGSLAAPRRHMPRGRQDDEASEMAAALVEPDSPGLHAVSGTLVPPCLPRRK